MVRIRRLQSHDENGETYETAYAIEHANGIIEFRYNLTWEFLGGRYGAIIRDSGLPLEQIEQAPFGHTMRWLPIETFDLPYQVVEEMLDRACYIPRLKKKTLAPAT